MPSFVTVTSGVTAQAQDVNQLILAMNGTAGSGVPISLTAVNDSVNFALAVKNADPTNSRSLQVLRANNNVLLQADVNGVIVSPDGGATTGQVLSVNATQTLTNKTLVVPVGAPTTDGALGEVAGGVLNVGNGTASIPFGAYKIAETVLGVATASFDFTAIPATYRHLVLEVMGRFDNAVVTASSLMKFNNDGGANYNRSYSSFTGVGAAASTEGVAQTSLYLGEFPAANATASYSGYAVVFIAHYAGTTLFKNIKFTGGVATPNGATTSVYTTGQGNWANTGAINRITLAGVTNWIAGSVATLYGVP